MNDIEKALRSELRDPEYSEGYAESFLNSYIATQIKVIREQREMTQAQLGELIGTTQAGVSRYENVNYSSWNVKSLIKMARAFHVRLKVSFESFGTLPSEVTDFNRASLERVSREDDPDLSGQSPEEIEVIQDLMAKYLHRSKDVTPIDTHPEWQGSPQFKELSQEAQGGANAAYGSY